ncbi:MAG: recombinase family protein [Bacilli bacterium]
MFVETGTEYGYARVSTNRQDGAYEMTALLNAGVKQSNIFFEKESGSNESREKFNELLGIVKAGDTIRSTEITRIARNMRNLIDIVELTNKLKLRLIIGNLVVDCRTDELDPITEVTLLVIGMFGMFDLKMKKHQIMLGLENAVASGNKLGRKFKTKDDIDEKFYKYYSQYKNNQINLTELSKLSGVCRQTCYNLIDLIES